MYIDAANRAGATSNNRDCMMYGPRAHRSFVDSIRPTKPIISTKVECVSTHNLSKDHRHVAGHLQIPPTTSGIKYHVFRLHI